MTGNQLTPLGWTLVTTDTSNEPLMHPTGVKHHVNGCGAINRNTRFITGTEQQLDDAMPCLTCVAKLTRIAS